MLLRALVCEGLEHPGGLLSAGVLEPAVPRDARSPHGVGSDRGSRLCEASGPRPELFRG